VIEQYTGEIRTRLEATTVRRVAESPRLESTLKIAALKRLGDLLAAQRPCMRDDL
jgi:hypothetical protein